MYTNTRLFTLIFCLRSRLAGASFFLTHWMPKFWNVKLMSGLVMSTLHTPCLQLPKSKYSFSYAQEY